MREPDAATICIGARTPATPTATGYAHPDYARSLGEFGTPRALPRAAGWVLERTISGSTDRDAMGCYPLFACRSWRHLPEDLAELGRNWVTLTLVADPFGDHDPALLHRCFPDLATPFKQHYVVDLTKPVEESVSRHHRRYARRALAQIDVDVVTDPPAFLDDWMRLHAQLVARHRIRGLRAFSREAFARQLALPDLVVLRASHGGEPIGAQLWLVQGDVAHGHVLAFSEAGYRLGAPYALNMAAIEHFATRVRFCDIGAAPGTTGAGAEGLLRFKRGWANGGTRTAWLCGRILDRARYADRCRAAEALATVSRAAQPDAADYFPAYRAGELTDADDSSAAPTS
jgi:hypothetical protein